jgi:hypothetical protein
MAWTRTCSPATTSAQRWRCAAAAGGSLTFGAGAFRCDNAPVFTAQGIPSGCVFMTEAERFERLILTDPEVT